MPSRISAGSPRARSNGEYGFFIDELTTLLRHRIISPSANRARCLDAQRASRCDQDMVGITNSAPARMPVGQRLVIVFNRV